MSGIIDCVVENILLESNGESEFFSAVRGIECDERGMQEETKTTQSSKRPIREVDIEEAGDHLHFTVNLGGSNWSSVVGIDDGHVFCDCPDFFYKKGLRDNIDISDIQHQCKHIKAAIAELMNHGVLTVDDLKRRRK